MNKKISTTLAFSVIIILAIIVAGISFYLWKGVNFKNNIKVNISKKNKVACTMEAKLCPDGSAVSRVAPNCEFAPCPEVVGIADKIIITSPKPNDTIASPISITGKAVGSWFSEAVFPVEIYDSNDKLLGKTTAQLVPKSDTDTWMTNDFVDFKADLKFAESKTDTGYILFKKDNPSGKQENDQSFKLEVKKFNKPTISLFFKSDVLESDILSIKNEFEKLDGVESVQYISKDMALEEFKKANSNEPEILKEIQDIKNNPLSASLKIKINNLSRYNEIKTYINKSSFISKIQNIDTTLKFTN
jgi:hypothetical protein